MIIELSGYRYDITAATMTGRRSENQDRAGFVSGGPDGTVVGTSDEVSVVSKRPRRPFLLAYVCDGMGGMRDGSAASGLLSEALVDWASYYQGKSVGDLTDSFSGSVSDAEGRITAGYPGSGTTLSAVLTIGGSWISAHLGDSRCYALYQDHIWRTADHSPVERMFRDGLIDEDEMNTHPMSNVVSKYVGGGYAADIEVETIGSGWDELVICSDGASGSMPPIEFIDLLCRSTDAEQIIEGCYEHGSKDNISAVRIGSIGRVPR